jgi:hypothetical protein
MEDSMKTKRLFGMAATFGMLAWMIQPSLAEFEHQYSTQDSSEHGCCSEMMGYSEPESHPARHLHHLLRHQKEIGLTEQQVNKLKAIDLDCEVIRIKIKAERHIAERELLALVEDRRLSSRLLKPRLNRANCWKWVCGWRHLKLDVRH